MDLKLPTCNPFGGESYSYIDRVASDADFGLHSRFARDVQGKRNSKFDYDYGNYDDGGSGEFITRATEIILIFSSNFLKGI